MFLESFSQLEKISQIVGNLPQYVQGGGGNTSVKINDELMAVKASGYKLKQITTSEGFVVINYKNIKKYYDNVDLSSDLDYEKDSIRFTRENIIRVEGIKELRPSVEAGFHSILRKYVIHTHPVYANIICCSTEGESLMNKIFPSEKWNTLWIPYINPGFFLTVKIKEALGKFKDKKGHPEIIFMENHGLIVHSDDMEECIRLHSEVNSRIKEYFNIKEEYPQIEILQSTDGSLKSNTEYLIQFFRTRKLEDNFFEKYSLYPDQLVYLNDSISMDENVKNKLMINNKTGELAYNTNYNEALTIEETLLGYIYVIDNIQKLGLNVKSMSGKEIDFIRNWESEKYRKSLAKQI